jgi:hypothetical protein
MGIVSKTSRQTCTTLRLKKWLAPSSRHLPRKSGWHLLRGTSFEAPPPPKVVGTFFEAPPSPKVVGTFFEAPPSPKVVGTFFEAPPSPKVVGTFFEAPPSPKVVGTFFEAPPSPKVVGTFFEAPSSGTFFEAPPSPKVVGTFLPARNTNFPLDTRVRPGCDRLAVGAPWVCRTLRKGGAVSIQRLPSSSARSRLPARRVAQALAWLPFVVALACSATGQTRTTGTGGDGGDATSGSAQGGSGSGGEGGLLFDAGNQQDGAPGASCQFVDLLFVIDNSGSMGKYQESLAAAFPSFVDAMFQKLPPNIDLHVGIVTTSFFTGSCSEAVTNCVTTATQQEILAHYVKPTDGDTGTNGEQGRFFTWEGKPFFAVNTSDPNTAPLKTWFSSAAVAAGETGCSFEMASAAAGYAAHPANAPTNGGFFRDEDGVLLVIVLSDEPDKSPEGTAVYRDMLTSVKTKCGGDKCILVAGLVNPCIENVNNALWQFMNAFGEPPVWGDLKEPAQYSQVVGDALAQVVKQTCDEIAVPK